MDLSLL